MDLFILWVLFALAVGAWARAWNRDFFSYMLVSALVSPVFGAIVLLLKGADEKPDSGGCCRRRWGHGQ